MVTELGKARDETCPPLVRDAEHPRRVEGMAENHCLSDEAGGRQMRLDRHSWMVEIGTLADIERRMGVEYLQSAHQKEREADDINPMRDTHRRGMAAIPVLGDRQIVGG